MQPRGCFCSGALLPSHLDRIALKKPKLVRIRTRGLCRLGTGWFCGWCVCGVGTGRRWRCPRWLQVRAISVPGLGAQGCSKPKVSQQRWQRLLCKPQLLRCLCVLLSIGCCAGCNVAELGRVPSSDGWLRALLHTLGSAASCPSCCPVKPRSLILSRWGSRDKFSPWSAARPWPLSSDVGALKGSVGLCQNQCQLGRIGIGG